MSNHKLNTEDKIFQSAHNIFLLYGYHGTTLQKIALEAGVNKSAIHYYFRSKEKLYAKVIVYLIENILKTDINFSINQESLKKQKWFVSTELYNNQNFLEGILKVFYLDNWEIRLNNIKKLLKIEETL